MDRPLQERHIDGRKLKTQIRYPGDKQPGVGEKADPEQRLAQRAEVEYVDLLHYHKPRKSDSLCKCVAVSPGQVVVEKPQSHQSHVSTEQKYPRNASPIQQVRLWRSRRTIHDPAFRRFNAQRYCGHTIRDEVNPQDLHRQKDER